MISATVSRSLQTTVKASAALCVSVMLAANVARAQPANRTPAERADQTTQTTHETYAADVNGRLVLTTRSVEEGKWVAPGIYHVETMLSRRDIDGALRPMERVEHTERRLNATVVEHDDRQFVRDINGRWQLTETRSGEIRELGPSGRVEEQTIRRVDLNGTPILSEKSVSRQLEADGRGEVVTERYSRDSVVSSDGRLGLNQRVRISSTAMANGDRSTIEEVEARNPATPQDRMRVTKRTVATERNAGPDRRIAERQLFELDLNGRLILVGTEREAIATTHGR